MSELQFELRSFSAASLEQYRELICDPAVTKHMPLAETAYSDDWIQNWIRSKENTWLEKDRGPWSVWGNQNFAGWVGLEPDDEFLSLGLVLHKKFWGSGEAILRLVFSRWHENLNGRRVSVEFPASRKSELWATQLSLKSIGQVEISGVTFSRYELNPLLFV